MALSAPDLLHMTHQQLNDQFRNAEAGPFPDGIVTFAPDTVMSETAANLAHLIVWKGKVLDSGKGENLQTSKRPDNGELIGPRLHRHPPLPRAWLPRYTAFRRLLHLPGPARFEEITSNKAWVAELREVYGDDINQVDLISGMYAADRPDGFAFSDTAFRIFILMASRRLSSDRFFTDSFTETVYTREGMLWIDQNTMGTVLLRHALALLPYLSGVGSAFAIWKRAATKGTGGKHK